MSEDVLEVAVAELRPSLEALLMIADQPLDETTLATAVGHPVSDVAGALTDLAAEYAEQGRGFELRNVAGSQLDGRLVWLFATQVLRGRHAEHRGRIADLETELQVQRKVRGMLDQPFLLGPPLA